MSIRWASLVIDCQDIKAQGAWWAEALGWQVIYESDEEVEVAPADKREPTLCFVSAPDGHTVKNRVHIDLAPRAGESQADEVNRLIGLGASHADVGQAPTATWVVLADPEGNEFCVLSPRDPAPDAS